MEKYLVFSVAEYQQRTAKARQLMEEQGIDACIFSKGANIVYFSGYLTTLFNSEFRPFLYVLPRKGNPVLVVPDLEKGGAQKTSWVDDVRVWGGSTRCQGPDPITLLADVMKELHLEKGKIGLELGHGQRLGMTYEQFMDVKKALPGVEFVNHDNVVWPVRMIKSPAEIEFMRKSGIANDRGFEAAVDAIREGATEKEVEMAMTTAFIKAGAIPAFMTVTAGVNRYDMMNPVASDQVVMKKGDMVVMDFGCCYKGYYSDVTRGVFVGQPHPRAAELYKAVNDVNEHCLKVIKPGNRINEIDAAAEARIKELGYRDLMLHRTGHALGLEVHEEPSIGPADNTILQPGMCLALEPGLYDYSVGGFRIENNIVITETGFEFLTNGSTDIIVK